MQVQFQSYNYNFTAATKYPVIPKKELLECIKNGSSYKEISEKYNVPGQVITRSLHWFGLKSPTLAEREKNRRDVLNLYNQGYSVKKIRKELALRTDLIKRVIKSYNEEQANKQDTVLKTVIDKLNMSEEDLKKYLK